MTNFNESKLSRIIARRIIVPEDRSQLLPFCTPIYCPNYNGVRASRVTVIKPNTTLFNVDSTNPNAVDNTFDIVLSKSVKRTYFVPHEVDLETDVDLMDMIKSDFGVQFKKEVSNEILAQITAVKANITKLNMGTTTAEAVGTVLADNILNGTGQKYSIYKYDNGAPITYIQSSAQPNLDDLVLSKEDPNSMFEMLGAIKRICSNKDDVSVPALYLCEKPTLLLDADKFKEYQIDLCSGATKSYAEDKLNVDTTKVDISAVGQGIFGTNDTFAVAFTEPKISVVADKDFFADNICVEVDFGVTLVHTDNIRLFT